MKASRKITSYQSLAQEIDTIEPLVELRRWERAAHRMGALAAQLEKLPAACEADRATIESALTELAALAERVRSDEVISPKTAG